jgi:TRAP transporter TAXI family solute receptor
MKIQMTKILTFLALLSIGILSTMNSVQAKDTFITIGTGGITGVYYPTGVAIAKMVNKEKEEHRIRAIVESTAGSVFNVNAIMADDIEFGMVQSDLQFQAMNGIAEWKDSGPQTALRAILSLYPETVTLVAGADTGIKHIRDLTGKPVNIGNLGSGHHQNAIDALKAAGIDYQRDIKASSSKIQDASKMLQEHTIDAFFYTAGHPSAALEDATSGTRKVFIADITDIDDMLQSVPYYTKATIPINLYPGASNKHDIKTFGVKATLVTSAAVPDDIVYIVTKAIFENFTDFRKLHPAYSSLSRESMLKGLSAPIHPGAMRYFKEAGLR